MPPEARPVWQVARYLREMLERDPAMADLWIGGEISNLTTSSAGHIYFTLKDQGGALRCVYFRNSNVRARLKEPMRNGDAVIVHGKIEFYPQGGTLQCMVDFAQPAGVGALQAEFERRRARFEEDGLFDPARKRRLPQFPRTIGVITSQTGAAYHDITTILERRWPLATVLFRATPVQGDDAAIEIAEAVRSIGLHRKPEARPDVVIVGRGGGSAEDLWAFNEEPVIRAIHGCPVPVISAVGHETDVTLADLVADVRAPTPRRRQNSLRPTGSRWRGPSARWRQPSTHARASGRGSPARHRTGSRTAWIGFCPTRTAGSAASPRTPTASPTSPTARPARRARRRRASLRACRRSRRTPRSRAATPSSRRRTGHLPRGPPRCRLATRSMCAGRTDHDPRQSVPRTAAVQRVAR